MRRYHAKLLLFGEYTITEGSNALAIPYRALFGHWTFENKHLANAKLSRQYLFEFLVFLKSKNLNNEFPKIDTLKLEIDLNNGLWFESNIPTGYGMGSSGAFCAAIYDVYCEEKKKNSWELKHDLSQLESFFHGKSSGIDPLVSYLDTAIKISENKIEAYDLFNIEEISDKLDIFLIDSGKPRKTTVLVESFIQKRNSENFRIKFLFPAVNLVETLIDDLFNKKDEFIKNIKELSKIQYLHMQEMILEEHHNIWKRGIDKDDYYLKLCGAGGGGFVLGFTKNWDKTSKQLCNYKLIKIT